MGDMGARRAEVVSQDASRTRPWVVTSASAIGWALFTMVILHVVSSHDPVLDTISSYAFTERGSGLLEASVLSLAIGSLALLGALLAAGVAMGQTGALLLITWSFGLATAALFPADFADTVDVTTGRVHQYASLLAFLSLPGVGFAIADRLRDVAGMERSRVLLLRASWIGVLSLGVFGLSYALNAIGDVPVLQQLSATLPVGLAQRMTLLTDLALLTTLVLVAAKAPGASASTTKQGQLRH
ncbi:Protein of unknown function [Amycolatopsis marina]|uniref:DUF998 domain-containing protein n=1 Tax=Amycolatopsis marina TaxID=490629 RepID=A0A1I0XIT4_9PSEU|nr:DUF998 domain-containing protein [Amycolatopsis marina]SFB00336.1 Protein of unknown function [Amycolatopsis marina]